MSRDDALALAGTVAGLGLVYGLLHLPFAGAVIGWFVLSVGLYVAASGRPEPLWRGILIGLNTGLNFALLLRWLDVPLALLPSAVNLLAASPLSRQPRFRQWLGWMGWLLPLSWPATLIGLGAFLLHLLRPRSVRRVWVDSATGSVVLQGGWLWWPGFHGGYSLGQFAFLTPDALSVLPHETGHTLNNAAFGSLFHFIGAVDELLVQKHWADAYAERLAEGHHPHTRHAGVIRLWGDSGTQQGRSDKVEA